MLIEFKIKSQLTICYWSRFVLHGEEQVFHIPFYQERTSDYFHDFVDIASDFHFMYNNRNQAISADSHIYLYPYGILRLFPKSSDTQVLFYPLEEQFHLPSVFVKEYYLFGREDEVVGIECECLIQIRDISYYFENTHAKIYRRRIKRIEFSFNTEFSPNSDALSHIYHMISEIFKDMPVSIRVAFQ